MPFRSMESNRPLYTSQEACRLVYGKSDPTTVHKFRRLQLRHKTIGARTEDIGVDFGGLRQCLVFTLDEIAFLSSRVRAGVSKQFYRLPDNSLTKK